MNEARIRSRSISFLAALSLMCTGYLMAQPVDMQWARAMQGAGTQLSAGTAVGPDGSVYWVGTFSGSMDLNTGPGTQTVTSAGSNDIFLVKHDGQGAFVWGQRYGGSAADIGNLVRILPDGNILLVTGFQSTVDYDPGPATLNFTAQGGSDFVLSKLTPDGELIWAKRYGGTGSIDAYDVAVDEDGVLLVSGRFGGSCVLDPEGVQGLHTSNGAVDAFVLKLDSSGNYLWSAAVGGTGNDTMWAVCQGAGGLVFACGTSNNALDVNPGPATQTLVCGGSWFSFMLIFDQDGVFQVAREFNTTNSQGQTETKAMRANSLGEVFVVGRSSINSEMPNGSLITPPGGRGAFIAKFSPEGVFQWARPFGATYILELRMVIDASDKIFIHGSFDDTMDIDPGPATELLSTSGNLDLFLIKLAADGNFILGFAIGSGSLDSPGELSLDPEGAIYLTGEYGGTMDVQPGPEQSLFSNLGATDAFLVRYDPVPCSELQYQVSEFNPVQCEQPGIISGVIAGGTPPYGFTWPNLPPPDSLSMSIPEPGVYPIQIWDSDGCAQTRTLIMGGTPYYGQFDLFPLLISAPLQAGFASDIWLHVENGGCVPVDGNAVLTLPDGVTFTSSEPAPLSVVGQVVTWSFTGVEPGTPFIVLLNVAVSPTNMIGEWLCFEAVVTPVQADAVPENNQLLTCRPVVAAYDPNDKAVFPEGVCPEAYVPLDQTLRYTVRFQNTGNAPANEVRIIDSLTTLLDPTTLRLLAHSHAMYAEWLEENVLQFTFPDIQLPDSTSDPLGSQGYVIFELDPVLDVADSAMVSNRVGIYFDFNEAVITNTVANTLVPTVPALCSTVGIATPEPDGGPVVYPNPNQGVFTVLVPGYSGMLEVRVLDTAGRTILWNPALSNGTLVKLPSDATGLFVLVLRTVDGIEVRSLLVVDPN